MSKEKLPSRILSKSITFLNLNTRDRIEIPLVGPIAGIPPAAVSNNDFRFLIFKIRPRCRRIPLGITVCHAVTGTVETIDSNFMEWLCEEVFTHTANHVVQTVTTFCTDFTVTFTKDFVDEVILVGS